MRPKTREEQAQMEKEFSDAITTVLLLGATFLVAFVATALYLKS